MKTPYHASTGSDSKPYVEGPGNGCGYYSGTLFPGMRLSNDADAEAAAKIANTAYQHGYEAAQRDIRNAMGC